MNLELSIAVTSFNGPELLERCLASLAPQARQAGAEVVVIGDWSADEGRRRGWEKRYPEVAWICAPPGSTVPQLRRLGPAHSRGQIVALLEDDCIPAATWCAAVAQAHREPYIAIGGAVEPGPYRRALDWAVYFCEYSQFMLPLAAQEARALPINNVSYKRLALTGLLAATGPDNGTPPGEGLYDVFVHRQMRQAGQTLKADPAVIVRNINTWTFAHLTSVPFHHGRGYAAMRIAGLAWWRRAPFLGMAALLPLLQVGRIARRVLSGRRLLRQAGSALPGIILISVCWSLGELAGYLRGPGSSLQQWRRLGAMSR